MKRTYTLFNRTRLSEALANACQARKRSWREAAREMGVQPSTLTRLNQGSNPSAEGFARMVAWLGLPAGYFLRPR